MFTNVNGVSEILSMSSAKAMEILNRFGAIQMLPGTEFTTFWNIEEFFDINVEEFRSLTGNYGFTISKAKQHIKRVSSYAQIIRYSPNAEFSRTEDGQRQICVNVGGIHKCAVIPNGAFNLYSPNAVLIIAAILHEGRYKNKKADKIMAAVFEDIKKSAVSQPVSVTTVTPELLASIIRAAVSESVNAVLDRFIAPGATLSL